MRNISCSHTKEKVRARTKFVTRRLGWKNLKPGTLLRVVEKAMGLKPGEKIVPLAVVRVTDVSFEQINLMTRPGRAVYEGEEATLEVHKEGFLDWTPKQFVEFFCRAFKCEPTQWVTRIEWTYESRCLSCGFEISKDSSFCGECACEEDSL